MKDYAEIFFYAYPQLGEWKCLIRGRARNCTGYKPNRDLDYPVCTYFSCDGEICNNREMIALEQLEEL